MRVWKFSDRDMRRAVQGQAFQEVKSFLECLTLTMKALRFFETPGNIFLEDGTSRHETGVLDDAMFVLIDLQQLAFIKFAGFSSFVQFVLPFLRVSPSVVS